MQVNHLIVFVCFVCFELHIKNHILWFLNICTLGRREKVDSRIYLFRWCCYENYFCFFFFIQPTAFILKVIHYGYMCFKLNQILVFDLKTNYCFVSFKTIKVNNKNLSYRFSYKIISYTLIFNFVRKVCTNKRSFIQKTMTNVIMLLFHIKISRCKFQYSFYFVIKIVQPTYKIYCNITEVVTPKFSGSILIKIFLF